MKREGRGLKAECSGQGGRGYCGSGQRAGRERRGIRDIKRGKSKKRRCGVLPGPSIRYNLVFKSANVVYQRKIRRRIYILCFCLNKIFINNVAIKNSGFAVNFNKADCGKTYIAFKRVLFFHLLKKIIFVLIHNYCG